MKYASILLGLAIFCVSPVRCLAGLPFVTTTTVTTPEPEQPSALSEENEQLRATVIRFLDASSHYHTGDLIVQSQMAELLDFLRKTRGHCLAAHAKWRRRALPDRAKLSIAFYREDGRETMLEAANALGGYAALDWLCQSKAGWKIMLESIHQGDAQRLIDSANALAKASDNESDSLTEADEDIDADADRTTRTKFEKIYTVEDYLHAIFSENSPQP